MTHSYSKQICCVLLALFMLVAPALGSGASGMAMSGGDPVLSGHMEQIENMGESEHCKQMQAVQSSVPDMLDANLSKQDAGSVSDCCDDTCHCSLACQLSAGIFQAPNMSSYFARQLIPYSPSYYLSITGELVSPPPIA